MIIKILVRTPKGQAKKAEGTLKLMLGVKRNYKVYTNDDDNEIAFQIEDDIRRCVKIINNSTKFKLLVKEIGKKAIRNKLIGHIGKFTDAQKKEFLDMLENNTEVEYVKEATAQELAKNQRSAFAKMKDFFKVS